MAGLDFGPPMPAYHPKKAAPPTNFLANFLVLLALIAVLLFVATWTGVIKCGVVPFWCDTYYSVMGKPKVLIVYGNEGLGNPELLQELMADPGFVGVKPTMLQIDRVNLGNLKPYALVIVERAKKIETKKLQDFVEYVNSGGRLVWTGDSGTELGTGDDYLYADESPDANQKEHSIIGPWTRKTGDTIVSFDQLISVNYKANYCAIKPCQKEIPTIAGNLRPEPTREHPLISSLATNLVLRVFDGEDFAIVNTTSGYVTTEVLSIDYGGELFDAENKPLGSSSPIIVVSGVGERVAYYAMPPELFANPKLARNQKYFSIVRNMYNGMLGR